MPVPANGARPPARRLLRDVTYDRLLEAILDGHFAPGERLYDDLLADWLQVSKTPVKEAVARLADQGLVEVRANKYTRVRAVSPDGLVDVLEMLGALLSAVLRGLPRDSTDAALVADAVVATARRGSCLDFVLESQSFLALSANHLAADAAEPLVHRARFLFSHLQLQLDDPAVAPALRAARQALAGRRWDDAAAAFSHVFARGTLRGIVAARAPEPPRPTTRDASRRACSGASAREGGDGGVGHPTGHQVSMGADLAVRRADRPDAAADGPDDDGWVTSPQWSRSAVASTALARSVATAVSALGPEASSALTDASTAVAQASRGTEAPTAASPNASRAEASTKARDAH